MKRSWNERADEEWEQAEVMKQENRKKREENRKAECLEKIKILFIVSAHMMNELLVPYNGNIKGL